MKIVVSGPTGLIGSALVTTLRQQGHEVLPAVPRPGVTTRAGADLASALAGAGVVIDVSPCPAFADATRQEGVRHSTGALLAAAAAGVRHYVALSAAGTERLESGDFRARAAQEHRIAESGLPYSIVHVAPVFEGIAALADDATDGRDVRLAPAFVQPLAVRDAALVVAKVVLGAPVNGIVEVAGPELYRLDLLVRQALRARHDPRVVVTDPHARYCGAPLHVCTLIPGEHAKLGETRLADWLNQPTPQP